MIEYAPKYTKIQNIFKRNSEKPHNILSGIFGNEAISYLLHADWIVQEKIDGTNIRIIWDGNRVTFGGKNTLDVENLPGRLRVHLEENYGTPEFEQVIEQKFGDTPITIYGEGYGHKIQTGAGYFPDEPDGRNDFIGFDVRLDGGYVSAQATEDILGELGIPVIPKLPYTMTIRELVLSTIDELDTNELNHEGTDKEIEGYVLRTAYPLYDHRGNRIICKLILDDLRKVVEEYEYEEIDIWFS